MNRRLAAAALAVTLVALPMHADFSALARAIDGQRGVSRVWIPFLGVARAMVRVVQPKGVHDFQLVTFRGVDKVDARELHKLLRTRLGAGFTPLVHARSKRSGEFSFVYAKPAANGKRIELVVLAHDDEDTVLVRVEADPEIVAREIEHEPRNVRKVARR